jgi:hypothetical protein
MAKLFYETVFAGAGFAGENWDITVGYNQSYTTTAGDVAFASADSSATLSVGTWPSWVVVGSILTTDDATNPGPFTVASVTTTKLTFVESVTDDTPVAAVEFDGSANTNIQDVLLGAGNGALTEDCPLVLTSTGALGAARTLDISGLEVETSAHGAQDLDGRWFYLSIQNSDVSATNTITVSGTTSVNGSASLVIQNTGDYMFHHVEGGVWRVNVLPRPEEKLSTMARVSFTAADWQADTGNRERIKVLQTGTAGAGEVGPHSIAAYDSYIVQVINTDITPNEIVDMEVQIDSNGDVILHKAPAQKDFNGIVLINGTLD